MVLDASVVIGLRDADDPRHPAARRAVDRARQLHRLVLPASAFAESLVRPLLSGLDEAVAGGPLLRLCTVGPLTASIAMTAARLRGQTSLRLPDALVVATGIELDAIQTLTFDDRWKGVDRRVKVLGAAAR